MQTEKGGDGFVVANGVAHVTAVKALRDPCGSAKPRGKTPLQSGIVGRHRGTCPAETPQDSVCPRRFPLLSTARQMENTCVNCDNVVKITLVLMEIYAPCVIGMCSYVKLVGRWEIQRALYKLIHHRLALLGYVELKDRNKVENMYDFF